MQSFLNFLAETANFVLPIYVFLSMLNVGLTQKPQAIIKQLKEWPFFLRMLVANFVVVPLAMFLMIQIVPLAPGLKIGLMIFSMAAGGPFLIKLTQNSEHEIALGASLMVLLVVATGIYLPLMLPLILPFIAVDGIDLLVTLVQQLILPIILGMLLDHFAHRFVKPIQPWVGKMGNYAMYVVIVGMLLGNIVQVMDLFGQGGILMGIIAVLVAVGIGYLLGGSKKEDNLQDIGALGTAQRNTAASLTVASANFSSNPEVILIITITSTLGIFMLLAISKYLSKDNDIKMQQF